MGDYNDGLWRAIGLLSGHASRLAADGLTIDDYDEIDACLDEIKGFVQSGREQLEKAYEVAGGADIKADKNRTEKANWQDLDLSNVKPGQDQRGA